MCERACACALLVYLLHICICICICFLSRSSVNTCVSLRAWAFEWVCVQAHAVAREIALLKRAFSSSVQKSNSRIRLRVVSSLSSAALPDMSPGSFIRFATLSTCRTPSRPAHRQSPRRQSMNHTPLWACVHAPSAFMCCLAGAVPQTGMATQGDTKPTCELHVGHEVWQPDATQRGGPDFKRGELRAPGTRSGARTARKPRGAHGFEAPRANGKTNAEQDAAPGDTRCTAYTRAHVLGALAFAQCLHWASCAHAPAGPSAIGCHTQARISLRGAVHQHLRYFGRGGTAGVLGQRHHPPLSAFVGLPVGAPS